MTETASCRSSGSRRGCFTNQRHWCYATTAWRAGVNGRVRSAPEGLRGIRAIDLSRRGPALLGLDHKQFPVRHLCETASVQTSSAVEPRRRGCSPRGSGSRQRWPRGRTVDCWIAPIPATSSRGWRPPLSGRDSGLVGSLLAASPAEQNTAEPGPEPLRFVRRVSGAQRHLLARRRHPGLRTA